MSVTYRLLCSVLYTKHLELQQQQYGVIRHIAYSETVKYSIARLG